MTYWLEIVQRNDGEHVTEASVQCEVNQIILPNDVNNEVPDSPDGRYETILHGVDDELVEEALRLDEDGVLPVMAELKAFMIGR